MKRLKTAAVILASVMLFGCVQAKDTEAVSVSETSLSESGNKADESSIIFPDNIEQVTEIKDNPISFDEAIGQDNAHESVSRGQRAFA